jgi:HTH-type transcriptional regulator / antitoxin HigA
MLNIKVIKTEAQYLAALKMADGIFDAKPDTPEGDQLELLLLLIEQYEKQYYPIAVPDPIEAIKFRMDQVGMTASDLGEVLGYRSRPSEILSRRRKLTLPMIRNLHHKLRIPADVLLQDYSLT